MNLAGVLFSTTHYTLVQIIMVQIEHMLIAVNIVYCDWKL